MKAKPILCPERLRRVPRQFSWIDERLVRDGHISRCTPNALALYLLLCTVEEGYEGGFSILKDYVRRVRPVRRPAFLTLAFAPGNVRRWTGAVVAPFR